MLDFDWRNAFSRTESLASLKLCCCHHYGFMRRKNYIVAPSSRMMAWNGEKTWLYKLSCYGFIQQYYLHPTFWSLELRSKYYIVSKIFGTFIKMKFSTISASLMATLALAAPTPTVNEVADIAQIAKRASITDVSSIYLVMKWTDVI